MHIGEATITNVHGMLATPYPFMAWLAAQPEDRIVGTDVAQNTKCALHGFLANCFGEDTGEDDDYNAAWYYKFCIDIDVIQWGGPGNTLGNHAYTLVTPAWARRFQNRTMRSHAVNMTYAAITAGTALKIMQKVLAKEQAREARKRIAGAA